MPRLLFVLIVPALVAAAVWWHEQRGRDQDARPPRLSDPEPYAASAEDAVIALDVVDDRGRPLAETALRVAFVEAADVPPPDTAVRVVTDRDGAIHARVPSPDGLRWIGAWADGDLRSCGFVEAPRRGVITVSPVPLLASGKVVDEDGLPAPDAAVQLMSRTTEGPAWRSELRRVACDRGGHFELRWAGKGVAAGLTASSPMHVLRRVRPVDPGSRGLRLVLQPAGRISGRIVGLGNLDPRELEVGLSGVGPRAEPVQSVPRRARSGPFATPGFDGRFVIDHIPAGEVQVVVVLARDRTVLMRGAEITVEAGVHLECSSIDVSRHVAVAEITVHRPGSSTTMPNVEITGDPLDVRARSVRTDADGRARLAVPREGASRVLLFHAAAAPTPVVIRAGKVDVHIRPPKFLKLTVVDAGPIRGKDVDLLVLAIPRGEDAVSQRSPCQEVVADLDDAFSLLVPRNGKYELRLALAARNGRRATIACRPPLLIDVDVRGNTFSFHDVVVEPAAFQRALDALGQ